MVIPLELDNLCRGMRFSTSFGCIGAFLAGLGRIWPVWAWPLLAGLGRFGRAMDGGGGAVAVPEVPVRRAAAGSYFFVVVLRVGRASCRSPLLSLLTCPLLTCIAAIVVLHCYRSERWGAVDFASGGCLGAKRTEKLAIPYRERLCLLRHRRTPAGWQLLSQTVSTASAFIAS